MSDAACSSTFFKATMALNLVLLIGNGLVLALLAFKLLKQRKEFEKLQTGITGRVANDDHYEPVRIVDPNAKVRAKVEQAKSMPEEGIYHVPQESAYINDSTAKKNLSYLEVTA
jgi:hypothetical protein